MSSVKAIFPSISISKKKPKTGSAGSPQSLPFLRPLTPESRRKQVVGSPNEPLKAFPPNSPPIAASPLSLTPNSSETNLASLENGVQLSQSTPDLRFGLRQVRSASQPTRPTSNLYQRDRESFSSLTGDRSHSVNSENSYFADVVEAPMIEQEDIIALTHHVRTFSEALSSLRNTFIECEENPDGDPPEVKAHERLGEVLSVLKGVLNKYQPLHSTDILASAGTLISKVKSHNYEDPSKVPDEFYESIDQLALAFSSSVSDFLMGEQDMVLNESSMSNEHSRSLEAFNDEDVEDNMGMLEVDERGYEEESEDEHDDLDDKDERKGSEKKESVDTSAEKANELDRALIQLEHGVDIAMQRTKIWAKYSKDIATYVDRRAHLELEYTNKLTKLAQTTRAAVAEENYLPFQSIFLTALDQDLDYAENTSKTYTALLNNRFMEPLTGRRNKHDRTRKELKDTWTKACKKLNEALVNLKKAKAMYVQKQQELEKSKSSEGGGKEESSSASLSAFARGIKSKKEGDTRKADEAEEIYKQCVYEANARQYELEKTKGHVLVELRQLIYQCDQTMKAVTCNYFQMMSKLASPAPIQFQTLADSSRIYEPGNQFAEFVRLQQANSPQAVDRKYHFEPYTPGGWTDKSQHTPSRHNSLFESRAHSAQSQMEENARMSPFTSRRNKSLQYNSSQALSSSHPPQAWSQKDNHSDGESTTSRSLPGSPTHSPSESRKNSRIPRAHSLEFVSSDDAGKESDDKAGLGNRNGTASPDSRRKRPTKSRPSSGPFQNSRLSPAAQTHTLKKLRSASKCRCCDSYVYFNGAECEVCGLTCHKKCLARLKMKCGTHARSRRRMTTFGVDINQHLQDTSTKEENIPFIISTCISDIDQRGLDVKGIYRVSGVKSRVEKLCQSFESGQEYADLSDTPPHVIAAVLKLYLRQLPEPLLTFDLYPDFIRIAKESFTFINNVTTCKKASEDEDLREDYDKLLGKLREVVEQLPKTNRVTAARLIMHLKEVSEHEESNAMPGSNLAIVFGPTLLRPCDTTSTLSSLVDMPHQTRLIELLITNPEVLELPGIDEPIEQDTPVEEFTSPKQRDREGSVFAVQSLRSGGNNPEESYEAEDESSFINTPDNHRPPFVTENSPDVRKSSLPISITGPNSPDNVTMSPSPSSRGSLGFGSEFFELLAKSNSRTDLQPDPSIPEFLLPDSPRDRPLPLGEDSDLEDEDEDDTTQGTSGSRTPDDELGTSNFGVSQRASFTRLSNENLADDDTLSSPRESSSSLREPSIISRSSSLYSVAPSFSSDFPDTDSLLPDLSDSVSPKGVDFSDKASGLFDTSDPRIRSFSGITDRPPRPRTLGLLKRNSDLPGRVYRVDEFSTGIFPMGIKSSVSDTNLAQSPDIVIEEEAQCRAFSEPVSSSAQSVESPEADVKLFVEKNNVKDDQNQVSFNECAIEQDSDGGEVCPVGSPDGQEETTVTSPVSSPLEEKTAESGLQSPGREPPPVPKKPSVKSPSKETRAFAVPEERVPTKETNVAEEAAPRELIVPVMTALQERRPSTPNCSTSQAAAATDASGRVSAGNELSGQAEKTSSGRVGTGNELSSQAEKTSSEEEKRPEGTPLKKRSTYTRISVKDRLQQYEKGRSESFDSSRKISDLSSVNTVASRKEIFETKEKSGLYKRVSDIGMKKPRSDSGSGSGSASGSPKGQRKRLLDSEAGANEKSGESNSHIALEKTRSLDQSRPDEPRRRHRRERSENSERPRSQYKERLRVDKKDSVKSDRPRSADFDALKLDYLEAEKGTLSPREIDIPIDSEDSERSDRLRKSPNTSPRGSRLNVRSPFPDDSNEEEREPQFV